MKIYTTKIKESWIIDRIKNEWIKNNPKINTNYISKADIIWVIAPWAIDYNFLTKNEFKKIIYSIYHIEDTSKNSTEIKNIKDVDKFVNAYHVISLKTKAKLSKITHKPIYFAPLWVNQKIWFPIEDKINLRKKYNFKQADFLVGSFQRDTEGSDLISPKLVKGPDIFINILKNYLNKPNLKVVLTGKRRQYVINELKNANIQFTYYEMINFKQMNELYNILDLYLVSSRLEGGPQALVECGLIKTPIISTNVGIADLLLHRDSIYDYTNLESFKKCRPEIEYAYNNAKLLTIPYGMKAYMEMFMEVYES